MKKKICIVVANFYPKISNNLIIGASKILIKNNIRKFDKIVTNGVFEIPVIISRKINKYDGFIALGCVIKGKTPHFNYISQSVINALMVLSVVNKKPIGNGILTCLNKKQAQQRSNNGLKNKGSEAAIATLSVLKI